MKKRVGMCALGLLAMLGSISPLGSEAALTNEDIVRLAEAALGPAVIIANIEASSTNFDTSVDRLVALAKAGVEEDVIAAMVKSGRGPAAASAADRGPRASPARSVADRAPQVSLAPVAVPVAGVAGPAYRAGDTFRDSLRSGGQGPVMAVIPAGSFRMGCLSGDDDCYDDEKPVHEVRIPAAFALSVYEVTFDDYDRFTYPNKVDDRGWGRGRRPVINVSWTDAKEYVAWLSGETGAEYRLPSEAEWEYAARAGTSTKYSWGNEIGVARANCEDCGSGWDNDRTAPVGSFAPNGWGLHDMHGNVWEWVEDCANASYSGASSDGGAWLRGDCASRVLRGGSCYSLPRYLRAAYRSRSTTGWGSHGIGFRVARTLTP